MRTDILLDDTNDLVVENGDFLLGESDGQHGKLLLSSVVGDWTQYPKTGVGLIQYLKGDFDGAGRRNVRLQFEGDGYKIKTLDFDPESGQINIDFN